MIMILDIDEKNYARYLRFRSLKDAGHFIGGDCGKSETKLISRNYSFQRER